MATLVLIIFTIGAATVGAAICKSITLVTNEKIKNMNL